MYPGACVAVLRAEEVQQVEHIRFTPRVESSKAPLEFYQLLKTVQRFKKTVVSSASTCAPYSAAQVERVEKRQEVVGAMRRDMLDDKRQYNGKGGAGLTVFVYSVPGAG